MDTKTRLIYMLPTKDPHQTWRHIQTVSGTVGKYSMQMELEKKAGVAILISERMGLQTVARHKKGHYIMINGPI